MWPVSNYSVVCELMAIMHKEAEHCVNKGSEDTDYKPASINTNKCKTNTFTMLARTQGHTICVLVSNSSDTNVNRNLVYKNIILIFISIQLAV